MLHACINARIPEVHVLDDAWDGGGEAPDLLQCVVACTLQCCAVNTWYGSAHTHIQQTSLLNSECGSDVCCAVHVHFMRLLAIAGEVEGPPGA